MGGSAGWWGFTEKGVEFPARFWVFPEAKEKKQKKGGGRIPGIKGENGMTQV